ncbi:hypothetical protein J6590_034195 [Homalodisca vitripennis]|nr:hypothetical protein J6590_034195 [Homalodisca vitripennis]
MTNTDFDSTREGPSPYFNSPDIFTVSCQSVESQMMILSSPCTFTTNSARWLHPKTTGRVEVWSESAGRGSDRTRRELTPVGLHKALIWVIPGLLRPSEPGRVLEDGLVACLIRAFDPTFRPLRWGILQGLQLKVLQ